MNELRQKLGLVAGLAGIALLLISVLARLAGHFTLGTFATGTLMLAGLSAVSVGCFLLLWAMTSGSATRA